MEQQCNSVALSLTDLITHPGSAFGKKAATNFREYCYSVVDEEWMPVDLYPQVNDATGQPVAGPSGGAWHTDVPFSLALGLLPQVCNDVL